MRPTRKITKHNLRAVPHVYDRILARLQREPVPIETISSQQNVSNELFSKVGIEQIKHHLVKELIDKMMDNGMIEFKQRDGDIPYSQSITAELNIVRNG